MNNTNIGFYIYLLLCGIIGFILGRLNAEPNNLKGSIIFLCVILSYISGKYFN